MAQLVIKVEGDKESLRQITEEAHQLMSELVAKSNPEAVLTVTIWEV